MSGSSHVHDRPATCAGELRAHIGALLSFVEEFSADGPKPGEFRDAERRVRSLAGAVERAATASVLEQYEIDAEQVVHDGRIWRRMKEASAATYHGMAGPMRVERRLYRQIGVRNGPTIVPLELRAGIVESLLTPEAAQSTADLMQKMTSREAEDTAGRLGVLGLSRTTMARTAEAMGRRWEEDRLAAEDHLLATLEVPQQAASVSVSVDRVSVPMEEPRPRRPGKPGKDAPKRPIEVVWRMAYCSVLTLHDAEGRALCSTRYGRMPGEEAATLIESALAGDLCGLLGERPDLEVVTVADGAPEMQNMLDRVTRDVEVRAKMIDFWHLMEKLAAAIEAVGRPVAPKLASWKQKLKADDRAIERIEVELRTWDVESKRTPNALHEALTYIGNHRERMRYASARAEGLPIGSGHVEATCKTIVSTRMKRSGARWKTAGGQAIMLLRSLATSARWDDGMDFLLDTYRSEDLSGQAVA